MQRDSDGLKYKSQAWGVSRAPGVEGRFLYPVINSRCYGLVIWALWLEVPFAGDKSPSCPQTYEAVSARRANHASPFPFSIHLPFHFEWVWTSLEEP